MAKDENADITAGLHNNTFRVCQPQKGAHRPGMDALLLAATVPQDQTGLIADYGAGNGAAGMAVLNRCPDCCADFIEINAQHTDLIEQAKSHSQNSHLKDRMSAVCCDVTDTHALRTLSGRGYGCYERIVCNPPFNTPHHRTSPNNDKAIAHNAEPEALKNWILSANTMLGPFGTITFIIRPDNLPEILMAFEPRFGEITLKPIQPKLEKAGQRVLISAKKGSRTPLRILPPFIVHEDDGMFTELAHSIFKGEAGLSMSA